MMLVNKIKVEIIYSSLVLEVVDDSWKKFDCSSSWFVETREDRVQLVVVCEAIPVLVKQLKAPPPTREENQYQHLVEMASDVFMLKNLANRTEGGISPLIELLQSVDMELKLSAAKIR
ncbi:hypothetical protein OROHE_007344 [Orobanche hederae]